MTSKNNIVVVKEEGTQVIKLALKLFIDGGYSEIPITHEQWQIADTLLKAIKEKEKYLRVAESKDMNELDQVDH